MQPCRCNCVFDFWCILFNSLIKLIKSGSHRFDYFLNIGLT
nr:MAG TPA: hypothetical protein [Caudoviricetes sp.]